jgi:outer membrane lipoprotein
MRRAVVTLALLTAGGCATSVPSAIRAPLQAVPTVAEVQQAPEQHIGRQVRWGGSILGVQNLADSTEIEVLARPLEDDGEPRASGAEAGRFIVRLPGFVDPAEYPKDRLLTVVGPITGLVTRDIGAYPYRYPVVAASSRYLWPEAEPPTAYPYPWPWFYGQYGYGPWYAPWYGPWYGPRYRPWYGPW